MSTTTIYDSDQWLAAAYRLQAGDIGVIRTDTLYGIVARADNQAAVERLYTVRQRDADKACIVLIADESQLYDPLPGRARAQLSKLWPGPVSVAMPARHSPAWLPLFKQTLAYRLPAPYWLRELLEVSGPLIAPSANLAGRPPARSRAEAEAYFGNGVDFYLEGGTVPADQAPSQLYNLETDGSLKRLR